MLEAALRRLDGWEGPIRADPAEVHAWRRADVADVHQDILRHPEQYTPWLRDELHAIYSLLD